MTDEWGCPLHDEPTFLCGYCYGLETSTRGGPESVDDAIRCDDCGNNTWYVGYREHKEWRESIHECTECGFTFTP